jgi:hypothetical protein
MSCQRYVGSTTSRKTERVDALEAVVRDRDVVVRALDALSPRARSVFDRIAAQGETTVPAVTNGGYFDPHMSSFGGSRRGNESIDALQALIERGLVGVERASQRCWVWLDVIAALNGYLYADWEPHPELPQVALADASPVGSLPPVIGRFEQLLDYLGVAANPALKTGGFGVRSVRDAAKALGFAVGEAGLLVWLAIELELVAPVEVVVRGRGRTRKADETWKLTTGAQEWRIQPAAVRWARLVQQWLDSPRLPADDVPERWEPQSGRIEDVTARAIFLCTLAEFGPGRGLLAADLTIVLGERHQMIFSATVVTSLLAQCRTLGLVPPTGPVGLSSSARTLLASRDSLERAVAAGAEQTFVVQPDHSVVAGPTLDPDVQATLVRVAELESDAGARVYRITEAQTTRALDSGMSVDEILGFLHANSRAGVSANVERTIRDSAARHGRLQVGTAASFVTSDDAALLARALTVKSAKLTPVNATTAISPLTEAKLLSVLRTRGLAPRGIDEPGDRPGAPPDAVALRHTYGQARPDELRSRLLLDDASIASLAKRLHDAPRPRAEAKDRRRAPGRRGRPQRPVPDEAELELVSFEELRALGDVLADPEG